MADAYEVEMAAAVDAVMVDDPAQLADERRDMLDFNMALASIAIIIALATALSVILDAEMAEAFTERNTDEQVIGISWMEPIYMPRHEECIDPDNGQEADYIGYGVGYEPSLSIDSKGNMQITAHKDLRWGGEGSPLPPPLSTDPGLWYACSDGDSTSWDYWASWFWISTNNGSNWTHGDGFEPTPGNMLFANYLAGGSECLGDEGDIAVDANDVIYYLDTTLEDNWWHRFTEGGESYEMGSCQRMNTMAADDRPWVAAQGDGIIHYLGNSGTSPPECSLDSGRYWYYRSVNGGNSFSQCYSMPGGWSTISSQKHGPYVFVAQENADSGSGTVQIRISDDYGEGTGPGPSDGSWQEPVELGPRNGNCPEGYPVVNNNEGGTVAVVWADCPSGDIGPWALRVAVSYDNGSNWSSWNATPFERGISMYPFVSISEDDVISIAFYGLDYGQGGAEDGYMAGKEWYLYAGALQSPQENDTWEFAIADPTPLHVVTDYEESNSDVHALHDFFETVISPDGTWIGIAYQQNVGLHPFEDNEEQRYIKFVRGNLML
jgi:hypothetical protein